MLGVRRTRRNGGSQGYVSGKTTGGHDHDRGGIRRCGAWRKFEGNALNVKARDGYRGDGERV
jgi:hypothetical protein